MMSIDRFMELNSRDFYFDVNVPEEDDIREALRRESNQEEEG